MQVIEIRNPAMKRNMELVRQLLLRIEEDKRMDGTQWVCFEASDFGIPDHSSEEIAYHLEMLVEEGFVRGKSGFMGMPVIHKLTWKGHEFLDDIRDPDIWTKTKERAKGLTTVGIELIWEIAKAEIKQKLGLP